MVFLCLILISSICAQNCGPTAGNAKCEGGSYPCCSQHNYCGSTSDHCDIGCQPLFGTCGGSAVENVVITECKRANSIAVTYDDGPYLYTSKLLDILRSNRVKVTFFVNGKNRMDINDRNATVLLRRAFREGHQIAHHTWSHVDLTQLNNTEITKEMTQLSDALARIIGRRPRIMRPPYGATTRSMENVVTTLGYKIVTWNLDTNDWKTPDIAPNVTDVFSGISPERKIVLGHDPLQYTVEPFTQNLINYIKQRGLRMMTVGECLGEAPYF
jgi:peptidoglycan/xylan/chitin deacetylase (PgdA/CDA1 family)